MNAYKLTVKEQRAFDKLAEAAIEIMSLPILHPSERKETAHEIHILQMRLLARPGLRHEGWGKQKRKRK